MRFTVNSLTFLLFLPGVVLICFCVYFLSTGIYQLAAWNKTSGVITEVVNIGTVENSFHEKATFVDDRGKSLEVIALSGFLNEEDTFEGTVTIVYDPANSANARIVFLRDYLLLLFLPFGALLVFLGWPFEKG